MSIGIAPSKQHRYCTIQRVLVLHRPKSIGIAPSKEYWYCLNNILLNANHERPSSLKAKEGSLLLGALTICLKALTVETYQAVWHPHTIISIFIFNPMNHHNVVYLVCPGNRHNAKFCINLVNAQWSSDLWIIIVIAQSWSSSMYTFNCLCNGYKCISRVCNISFYKRNIWLQIPIFSRLRLHCP